MGVCSSKARGWQMENKNYKMEIIFRKKNRGRSQTRWFEDLKRTTALNWIREAHNRNDWKSMKEAYV